MLENILKIASIHEPELIAKTVSLVNAKLELNLSMVVPLGIRVSLKRAWNTGS